MKKNGFTLAEVLIALTIIGITAAMAAPVLSNLRPDKYKTQVLRYYAMVSNATASVLDEYIPAKVTISEDDENTDVPEPCEGLKCINNPPALTRIEEELGLSGNNSTFSDGSTWSFGGANGNYTLTITTPGSKGKSFSFNIDNYGDVTGADDATRNYIKNAFDIKK